MGNINHKTMFKWSSSDDHRHPASSSWNRFLAVEKSRRRRQNLSNCCRQTTAFLFSHVGLSAMIVAYTVMGGFLFRALEGPFEKEEKNRVTEMKAKLIEEILHAVDAMECSVENDKARLIRDLRDAESDRIKGGYHGNKHGGIDSDETSKIASDETSGQRKNSSRTVGKRIDRSRAGPELFASRNRNRKRNRSALNSTLHQKFTSFALEILRAIKDSGWNGQDDNDDEGSLQWSHAGSILYAITVITTIGYGHIAPKTDWGRIVTIIYALIGIPLTFLYLSNIGNFLADCFRIFYKRVCCDVFCCKKCERQRRRERLKLRKQRVHAIQRSLVMKAAMHTLVAGDGRPPGRPGDRMRSVVGIPIENVADELGSTWIERSDIKGYGKGNCVGLQHFPLEGKELSPNYRKAFHSDSSLTSYGSEERAKRAPPKKFCRTNFKGVTISDSRSSNKCASRSPCEFFPGRNFDESRFSCTPLKKSTKTLNDGSNLLKFRKDSIFQSDSQLISSKPLLTSENDAPRGTKSLNKSGKLRKSLSVRFLQKSDKMRDQSCDNDLIINDQIINDLSRRKARFPSKLFFRQLSQHKSTNSKPPASNDCLFFNWQKRRRKEAEDDRARDNWQKLLAYSRQLSDENKRMTKCQLNYNSLPLKAESLMRDGGTSDAIGSTSRPPIGRRSDDSKSLVDFHSDRFPPREEKISNPKWSLADGSKEVSKRSKLNAKNGKMQQQQQQQTSNNHGARRKRCKRQQTHETPRKNSSDKSRAADRIGTGVLRNDSKNSIESYVTAICQSLSSIGEEETPVARSTNAPRPVSSSRHDKLHPHLAGNDDDDHHHHHHHQSEAHSRSPVGDSSRKRKSKERAGTKTPRQNSSTLRTVPSTDVPSPSRSSNALRFQLDLNPGPGPSLNPLFLCNSSSPGPCAQQETEDEFDDEEDCSKVTVPIYICLILISGYLFAGSALFSFWEGWNTITGSYFCFITLSTIGFGDIVPGTGVNDWASQAKLVLCTLWLALGLSLLAMCFNLMQEEVKERCRRLGVKLGLLKDDSKPVYE